MRRSMHLVSGIKKMKYRHKLVIFDMLHKGETERTDLPKVGYCLTRYVIEKRETLSPGRERLTVRLQSCLTRTIVVDLV